jgi:hypothetical protein
VTSYKHDIAYPRWKNKWSLARPGLARPGLAGGTASDKAPCFRKSVTIEEIDGINASGESSSYEIVI